MYCAKYNFEFLKKYYEEAEETKNESYVKAYAKLAAAVDIFIRQTQEENHEE